MRRDIGLSAIVVVVMVSLSCQSTTLTSTPSNAPNVPTQGNQVSTQYAITPTTTLPTTTESPLTATNIPVIATVIPASPTHYLPDLEFLYFQDYVEYYYYHIIGEVRNNTDNPMGFVKIVVTLYDDNDNMTGNDFAYTLLDVIPPGRKSPFELATDQYAGTTKYFLQVEGEVASLGRHDLIISNDKSSEEDNYLHIRGIVENKGTTDATFVKVIFTLYDRWGNVVGLGFTYTTLDTVPAGGSSPFDAATEHHPNFDHYILQVQGE
jgi:hypothetical protein